MNASEIIQGINVLSGVLELDITEKTREKVEEKLNKLLDLL